MLCHSIWVPGDSPVWLTAPGAVTWGMSSLLSKTGPWVTSDLQTPAILPTVLPMGPGLDLHVASSMQHVAGGMPWASLCTACSMHAGSMPACHVQHAQTSPPMLCASCGARARTRAHVHYVMAQGSVQGTYYTCSTNTGLDPCAGSSAWGRSLGLIQPMDWTCVTHSGHGAWWVWYHSSKSWTLVWVDFARFPVSS